MNCCGIDPPTTSLANSNRPAWQRRDPQEHFAELTGAAGLLLVPVMPLGSPRDGLAVRESSADASRPRR
jgi:hypothetical protein